MNIKIFFAYLTECVRCGKEPTYAGARAYRDAYKRAAAVPLPEMRPRVCRTEQKIEIPWFVRGSYSRG